MKWIVAALLVFCLACCSDSKKQISAVWQLKEMNINGTTLSGKSLGNWLWEFNDEGGYLVNIGGAIEKGTYKLEGAKLTMKSVTNSKKPEHIYLIARLDSISLSLTSESGKNKTTLYFLKTDIGKAVERD